MKKDMFFIMCITAGRPQICTIRQKLCEIKPKNLGHSFTAQKCFMPGFFLVPAIVKSVR